MIETPVAYIPMDRRQALVHGRQLTDHAVGAALFADISGFTRLTEMLALELGPRRGVEELTRYLNMVYDALITELHRFGGSVIGFSGDAITCWFGQDPGFEADPAELRAAACALAMQQGMAQFKDVATISGKTLTLTLKTAIAVGPVRRFVVGDPEIQVIDTLVGSSLDRLASAEHNAEKGEIILDETALEALGDKSVIRAWRRDEETGQVYGLLENLNIQVRAAPWPDIPARALSDKQVRPWLLHAVYERLKSGQGEFLAELRPAVALFLRFSGIDYDRDTEADKKLDRFICQVQVALAHYDGTLIQLTIGDKGSYLYAAFGAPVAHEDDALRAVSAAQELQRLASSNSNEILEIQIGVTQGRMRTGAYGGSAHRTYGVLGDAVNLAARLMQAAKPGQVLGSLEIFQGTDETFKWEKLPDLNVKGKSEPVAVYRLVGLELYKSIRLQEPQYKLPMVGRDAELEEISQKLDLVLQGRGQIVGICAEAGMGKSRLVAEVLRLSLGHRLVVYGGECQSYGTNSSYLVWHTIWRGFFSVDPTLPQAEMIPALADQLNKIDPGLTPRMPLLGAALNLTIPDNELTQAFDAKLRKASLEALLVDCLRQRARETPMLIVLEDSHWMDPLSQDLLEVIASAIVDLPVLLITAYRPPDIQRAQAPRLSQLRHFTQIGLSEFTPEEAGLLIRLKLEQVFGSTEKIPAELMEKVTVRAQGNPFYIEELLNFIKDRGVDLQDSKALAKLDFPASLYSLILSRIDQLNESFKTTLKVASVIGRLFPAAAVWGVYPQLGSLERVRSNLDYLSDLDITPLDAEPERTYLFKHVVTQEVAYESLPFATRAMLHGLIGQYIERTQAGNLDRVVDLLAHHYGLSDQLPKKREYLLKAGESAQADYANAAAIEYYQQVLPLLPEDEQVEVMLKLGKVLEAVGRWGEAGELYEQTMALTEKQQDQRGRAWCQTAIAELLRKQSRYVEASQWLQRAQKSFEDLGDQHGVGQVLHSRGTLAAQQGDYDSARHLYEQSLKIRQALQDKENIGSLLSNLAIIAEYQGDFVSSRKLHEEGLAIRRETGDRWAIAVSLNNLGIVVLNHGDLSEARACIEEALELQREVGVRWNIANTLNNLGNVARAAMDLRAAAGLYRESLLIYRDLRDKWALAYLFEDIGKLASLEGKLKRTLTLCAVGQALRDEIGAPLPPVEQEKLERLLEDARSALDDSASAAAWAKGLSLSLDQAIEEALEMG
jgi:adenylate cyclase